VVVMISRRTSHDSLLHKTDLRARHNLNETIVF
jgi:hypothetical protein